MPTLDDLITDLNGATTFSTLDLRNGYHQLELHPSSRYITTFSTHVALYRYKRLMFGINSASEIFQNTVAELLRDLPGCRNISDDIIVYGKTVAEHNTNLTAVLDRLRTNNVRLNREKCKISRKTVTFYGHVSAHMDCVPIPRRYHRSPKQLDQPTRQTLARCSAWRSMWRDLSPSSQRSSVRYVN